MQKCQLLQGTIIKRDGSEHLTSLLRLLVLLKREKNFNIKSSLYELVNIKSSLHELVIVGRSIVRSLPVQ